MLQTEHVPDWRFEMAASRYPFTDSALLQSSSTPKITVVNEMIVDASFYASFDPVGLYRIIVQEDNTVQLVFSSESGATTATATLVPGEDLVTVYEKDRVAGVLVLNEGWEQMAAAWPVGTHVFNQRRNQLVLGVIRTTTVRGLEALEHEGFSVDGEVWIIGENGVAVRPVSDSEIRVDVIGDPLFKRRRCEPTDTFVTPRFVKTINGFPPNQYGGFTVNTTVSSTVLRISADGSLKIEVVGQGVVE